MQGMDQYAAAFLDEASELLQELETTLLELEERPEDLELVGRAFRDLHTIKGSGAMFGFDEVAAFTHEVESAFDLVRSGKMPVTRGLVSLSLEAKDLIRGLLDGTGQGNGQERERLTAALRAIVLGSRREDAPASAPATKPQPPSLPSSFNAPKTYRVQFRPQPNLLQDGTNPLGLLDELRDLGACEVVAHSETVPALESLDPEACYFSWDAILTTDRGENAIRDAFIFVEDRCELRIDVIDDGRSDGAEPGYKRLGEILVERGDLSTEQLWEVLRSQKRIGDLLEEKGIVPPTAVKAAALEQQVVRELRSTREAAKAEPTASIRVAAEKLDSLVNLVGELVIAQARLSQTTCKERSEGALRDIDESRRRDAAIRAIAEDIERLAAALRDQTLDIRMVPIGTTFGRFKRLVRDLSGELGKDIDLVTEGAETELDKTVIERLGDPLVHVIRNSCDHGIEAPEVRRAKGKPAQGRVRLSAYQGGPNVFVEIVDDGAGLDSERIRAKAVERGLISADAKMSEKDLFGLILLPGFSTAQKVSSVSGRGVGMDVVKRAIDALRGSLEIESVPGTGTTIRIKLPLTLAIIEGLLVKVGEQTYVLPLSMVEECVELTRQDVENAHGSLLATVRGELVPYLRLRDWFSVGGERPEVEQIAVANVDGFRFGFAVDDVLGQHQTVIKTLGSMYRDVGELSGATILGDGSVALILDVPALASSALSAPRLAA